MTLQSSLLFICRILSHGCENNQSFVFFAQGTGCFLQTVWSGNESHENKLKSVLPVQNTVIREKGGKYEF